MTDTEAALEADLVGLKAAAEAANPGRPWYDAGDLTEALETACDAGDRADLDAAFIAAANPAVVLALIERVEAAEAKVAAVEALGWRLDCDLYRAGRR